MILIAMLQNYCHCGDMDATILVRHPEGQTRYALLFNGQRIGEVDTLEEAVEIREYLKRCNLRIEKARAILETALWGCKPKPPIFR